MLYEEVVQRAGESQQTVVVCEVNIEPRNSQSLAFHARLNFQEVGTLKKGDGSAVAFLAQHLGR